MEYQDASAIAWVVFSAVAVLVVMGFSLTWVASHLGVHNVTFFGGIGALIISGTVGSVVVWALGLLSIDPFIAAIPAFLAYLGMFAVLLRADFGKAVGVWFLSAIVSGFALGVFALIIVAVVAFPEPAQWACVGLLGLLASAGCLLWAATHSDVEMNFGGALTTMIISLVSAGIWWIMAYYVLGLSYWIVIPLIFPIHFLILKLRMDLSFGRALLVCSCAAIAALGFSSIVLLALLGRAIPYFREIVHGPGG